MTVSVQRSCQPASHSRSEERRLGTRGCPPWKRGTWSLLLVVERSVRRPGISAIRTSGLKYWGAVPCSALYASTATLNWMRCGARSQWRLTSASASICCTIYEMLTFTTSSTNSTVTSPKKCETVFWHLFGLYHEWSYTIQRWTHSYTRYFSHWTD